VDIENNDENTIKEYTFFVVLHPFFSHLDVHLFNAIDNQQYRHYTAYIQK